MVFTMVHLWLWKVGTCYRTNLTSWFLIGGARSIKIRRGLPWKSLVFLVGRGSSHPRAFLRQKGAGVPTPRPGDTRLMAPPCVQLGSRRPLR